MNSLSNATGEFGRELGAMLPKAVGLLAAAWVVVFLVLLFILQTVKRHMRPRILRADDNVRAWALSLRYRGQDVFGSERVPLTWFMRFWTNFASAPSLSFWSVAIPLILIMRGYHNAGLRLWLLPGLCFCGSMVLSNVLKRVFKRVRPERAAGSFGHKMKDASFPSGHSLTSLCFWSTMALSFALSGVAPLVAALFAVMAAMIVALTGLSRIYMGVHHPSDVIGGYFIGAVWSLAAYGLLSAALS